LGAGLLTPHDPDRRSHTLSNPSPRPDPMRPKFSLRLMLILIALVSVALYVFIVRPSAFANRFVAAIGEQDFDTAQRLLMNEREWRRVVNPDVSGMPDRIYAELMPREWQDVLRAQRRIVLRLSRHNNFRGNYVDWTEDFDVAARPRGLQIMLPANMNFNWPDVHETPPAVINPGEGIKLEPKLRTS